MWIMLCFKQTYQCSGQVEKFQCHAEWMQTDVSLISFKLDIYYSLSDIEYKRPLKYGVNGK